MSNETTRHVRQELAKQLGLLRILVCDAEKRQDQGFPATLTLVAFRSIVGQATLALELAGELKGLEG